MATLYVAPKKTKILVDGKSVTALDLQTALNTAEPGDVVRLTAGLYRDPVVMSLSGRADAPITVTGPDARRGEGVAVFDGGRTQKDGLHEFAYPTDSDWSFIKMTGVSHVIFENLSIRNCWPQTFYLRQCANLIFRDIDAIGGRRVVFAVSGRTRPTRGLLLERITWIQDPDHDMWRGKAKWKEVKKKPGYADKSWFNGGLFESETVENVGVVCGIQISIAGNLEAGLRCGGGFWLS